MSLRAYLLRLSGSESCIKTTLGEWSIERLLYSNSAHKVAVNGRRVAIQLADAGLGLQALALFDGLADSITLLPSSLSTHYLPELLEDAGCDILLTDSVVLPDGLPVSVICHELDEIGRVHGNLSEQKKSTEWHLVTSGTTGRPKLVSHTLESIIRTIKFGLPEGERPCWGLLYDYTRFAGLQVLLQAVLSGAHLIVPTVADSLSNKLRELVDEKCTHLSATPTLWRTIVMTAGSEMLPLRQITLGGEIADDRLLNILSEMFPKARVTHIYAATEAGVGFSVNDRKSGFPSSFLTSPPAGVSLRVENGRLYVKNTGVNPTYLGTNQNFGTEDGWIDTGDNVDVVGDRVYFLGRASGLLNIGGNKVHPEEIERILMEHPDVVLAKVYGRSSSIMGTIIQADVILNSSANDKISIGRELKEFVRLRAADDMVPAIIRVVDELDITSTGKLGRGAV